MANIGERIKYLRKKYNFTQEQFGKLFGIAKSTVSMYEKNKSVPDDEIKKKIADYFGVSLDWLMGRTDIPDFCALHGYNKEHKIVNRDPALQIQDFIEEISIFFASNKIAAEDKEKLFQTITELFWKYKNTKL